MVDPIRGDLGAGELETILVVPPPGRRGLPSATAVLAQQIADGGRSFRYSLVGHESGAGREDLYGPIGSLNNLSLLLRLARRDACALHHLLFTPSPRAVMALRVAGLLAKKPTVHTVPSAPDGAGDPRSLLFTPHTVVMCEATALTFQVSGARRPRVIRPGVQLPDDPPDRARCRQALIPSLLPEPWATDTLWLYPGDLSFSDGAETFLSAATELAATAPNTRFLLACRTKTPEAVNRRAALRREVERRGLQKHVLFLGQVDRMDLLLEAVDGIVLSVDTLRAKMDTPLVVLEAMARGVGAIVSNLPPLVELAGLGEGIEVVEASDPKALARAMTTWSGEAGLRLRMGQGARRTVEQHFQLPRMVKAYEDLYREAIHGG